MVFISFAEGCVWHLMKVNALYAFFKETDFSLVSIMLFPYFSPL